MASCGTLGRNWMCISYFSVTALKHHDHSNLEKKELAWAYNFQRAESTMVEIMVAGSRHGDRNRKWRVHIFTCERKQRGQTGNGVRL